MVVRANFRTLVLLLVFLLSVQTGFIVYHAVEVISPDIHARASAGMFSLCLNYQPEFNFTCNTSMRQNHDYHCQLNYSDPDNDSVTFFYENLSGFFEAEITDDGVLTANPDQEMVGERDVLIGVVDEKNCSNSEAAENVTFEIENVNDPPEYYRQISDLEWSLDETFRGIFLKDYFRDPDGDPLSYSHSFSSSQFSADIISSSEVIFSADECGEGYVTFTASDPYNETAQSHIIKINVPCEEPESSSGGSAGSTSPEECIPEWRCKDWSECYPNGTQKRQCTDIHGCSEDYKRNFWRECEYIPQCENGIQDPDEEGVDCGGPCPPCETCDDGILNNQEEEVDCGGPNCPPCKNCSDGIQNYGETGVDCGGPCPPCETCDDGIQNQGETGVDCGGPCPPCPDTETPAPVDDRSWLTAVLIPIVLGLTGLAVIYRLFRRSIHAFAARMWWYFTSKVPKQVLLTENQKSYLFNELDRLLGEQHGSSDLDEFQDDLAILFRKFYSYLIDEAYDLENAKEKIVQLKTVKEVKKFLVTGYSVTLGIEKTKKMSREMLDVHAELLRELVISLSRVDREEIARVLDEKTPAEKPTLSNVLGFLYNSILALQFSEIEISKEKYLKALYLYEALPVSDQENVYSTLHLTFGLISYVSSYASKK
ncbi:MAG: hypothetical protein ACLFTH_00685 [Candidatus Woesearchaeota archaeon]